MIITPLPPSISGAGAPKRRATSAIVVVVGAVVLFFAFLPYSYWILWPRHSLVLPVLLLLIALVRIARRHRRSGAIVIFVALAFLAWYGWVNWFSHALPVGRPVAVEIRAFGPSGGLTTTTITDPSQVARLVRPFASVSTLSGRALCVCDYWIVFRSVDGSAYTYRLRADGDILNDVPASAIQDVYVPDERIPFDLLPPSFRHRENVNSPCTQPADR